MDDAGRVAWLHRRAGFGLHPDALASEQQRSPREVLTGLVTQTVSADPWSDVEFDGDRERPNSVVAWMAHLGASTSPFVDRRTWNLHGWLVSGMDKAPPVTVVDQMRMFAEHGGGSFPDLLRRLTVDRAMLVYLDGRRSTKEAPNENYGRELLELFALGIGNYDEADVKAAARALTGWMVGRQSDEAVFVATRHDDTPQTLLNVDGVHDVDTVIRAVVAHPAHARFVATKVVQLYLGDPGQLRDVVDQLADVYTADPRLDVVITRALELGLDGERSPLVLSPVPWFVMALRACAVDLRELTSALPLWARQSGQIPLLPPGVAGWPIGTDWFNSSAMVARATIAAVIADATSESEPCAVAAADADLDSLASALGLTEPFTPSTAAAVRGAPDPTARLTLALISPENLLS